MRKKLATAGGQQLTATPDLQRGVEDAAPPWDYNPSSWRQRLPICLLGLSTAGIAFYMAAYQWRLIPGVWDPVFGEQTERVLDSDVSDEMRSWVLIPDAALGAVGYLSEAILALAGSTRRWRDRPWLVTLFGIDVIPLGVVSAILVVMQGTVVGAWCFLCLVTAVISLVLVLYAYDEVWSSILLLQGVWRTTHSRRKLWNAFWGREPSVNGASAQFATRFASWPRVMEMLLGTWLIIAGFVLRGPDSSFWRWNEIASGAAIVALACISFSPRFGKAHLLEIVVGLWLVGSAFVVYQAPAPPAIQNALLTVFVLVNFAVIPGQARGSDYKRELNLAATHPA